MCTVPYQAKSQDNKWLLYELVDNITFNKVSADIEFDGYHLNLDNDTLSDYSNRYQDIEIVFSPKSKIVSSLSYKSEYRYENGVSTDTYLHHCRLYFSELFISSLYSLAQAMMVLASSFVILASCGVCSLLSTTTRTGLSVFFASIL